MMPLTHITIYFIAAMHIEKETPIRKVIPSEKKHLNFSHHKVSIENVPYWIPIVKAEY
jgi:hypothetical protein